MFFCTEIEFSGKLEEISVRPEVSVSDKQTPPRHPVVVPPRPPLWSLMLARFASICTEKKPVEKHLMRMLKPLSLLTVLAVLLFGSAANAQAPASTDSKALDTAYEQIWQHVNDSYTGKLPAGWDNARQRFQGKLTSPGDIRSALDIV
ncbi:MAG: hypothetical protein K2X97_08720, partial [Mycobacteriaceae bacterium]|nr:hypothetical protein [Mycobacteriaceae bacterium]